MNVQDIPHGKLHIEASACDNVSSSDRERMIDIATVYYPKPESTREILAHHMQLADSILLARDKNGNVVGYSVASVKNTLTPFCSQPIRLIYQRMLYLSPGYLYRGLGKRLLKATFVDLLGPLWAFRRFALVCRTQNPVVARLLTMFTVSYPQHGKQAPDEVQDFARSLLPMLGARKLDAQYRLIGTLEPYKDMDYTDIWNKYLQRHHNSFEDMMLHSAFTTKNGRIINSGAFVFMVAYSKPLQFIRYIYR